MPPVLWFKSSLGLNNKVDPLRVDFDPQAGVQDLAIAYNVNHDRTGRLSRRKGWEDTAIANPCHSLFCDGGECLFVTGDALCVLGKDMTYRAIRNVTEGARMRYVQLEDRVYYANGHETGYVKDGVSWGWVKPADVPGPETNRVFSSPPIGSILAYFNGRMYVVQGSTCWYSEPFGVNLFDLARSYFSAGSGIRMLRPVKGGIFMSDENSLYFLSGNSPKEFIWNRVATYPAVEGTDVLLDGSKVGDGRMRGVVAMWVSTEGICLGTETGEMVNLTERKVVYPGALYGAGLFMGDRYIATLEP